MVSNKSSVNINVYDIIFNYNEKTNRTYDKTFIYSMWLFKKKRYKGKHKFVEKKKKKKIVPVMPKVRQPIRSMPSSKHGIRSIQKHKMNTD